MGKLDGKTAIVTGGASGIGEAAVKLFAKEGCRLVIADIDDDRGSSLAASLSNGAIYHRTNVSREEEVISLIRKSVDSFGRIDCMFNNAGVSGVLKPIEEVSVAEYERLVDINLKGVFLGMKHAAPIMKRQRSGSIINTSSIGGLKSSPAPYIYSAAKAAVNHLTRCVATELGEWNVRVNSISPGATLTPIFLKDRSMTDAQKEELLNGLEKGLSGYQPIPRAGLPEDIAKAALYLACDDSSFVTGINLVVDGGAVCGDRWSAMMEQQEKI